MKQVKVTLVGEAGQVHEFIDGDFVPPYTYRPIAKPVEEKIEVKKEEAPSLVCSVLHTHNEEDNKEIEKMTTENTATETPATQVTESATVDIVRNFLKNKSEPASRSDVLEATGITPTQWATAIKTLTNIGVVIQTGTKRGARYAFVK